MTSPSTKLLIRPNSLRTHQTQQTDNDGVDLLITEVSVCDHQKCCHRRDRYYPWLVGQLFLRTLTTTTTTTSNDNVDSVSTETPIFESCRPCTNNPYVIHFNGHEGVKENLAWILTHLVGLTATPFKAAEIFPDVAQFLCDSADIIITGDLVMSYTHPAISQRWDLTRDGGKGYPNLYWVVNNPWEDEYLFGKVGVNISARLIRPVGYSFVSSKELSEYPGDPTKIAVQYTDGLIEKNLIDYNIPYEKIGSKYGGSEALKRYKFYIELKYQVSTMKMYENIANGVVIVAPSPRFFKEVVESFDIV
ncbi:hypothetical protein HDU76_002859 [Blyttiomyces sp. JEL0837]|nr:hypothetical protein HDU76_002859 [Blyttiomyces sp. JEL0837]